jgi:isoamylase
VVISPFFDWANDTPLRIPSTRPSSRGARQGDDHPPSEIPEDVRGTYSGMAHPVMIARLKRLGVTAVELMPVHQFVHDSGLTERGLSN